MEVLQSKDAKDFNDVKELQKQNIALLELVRQLQVKLYVAESRLKEKELYEDELKKSHERELFRLNALFERLLNETFARLSTRSENTNGADAAPKAQTLNSSGSGVFPSNAKRVNLTPTTIADTPIGSASASSQFSQLTIGTVGTIGTATRHNVASFRGVPATEATTPPGDKRPQLSTKTDDQTQPSAKTEEDGRVAPPDQRRSRPSSAIRQSPAGLTPPSASPDSFIWTGGQTSI